MIDIGLWCDNERAIRNCEQHYLYGEDDYVIHDDDDCDNSENYPDDTDEEDYD